MKRTIAISVVAVLAFASLASAQSSTAVTPSSKPLAEVAKTEEARRNSIKKPAKVYTNDSLRPVPPASAPPPSSGAPAASGNASAGTTPAEAPAGAPDAAAAAPAGKMDQAYWQGRIQAARDTVARSQLFAESLQTRINSLNTDFVNRDNRVEREKIDMDRKAALAELDRVNKEIQQQTKAITAIEDEARRAGVPPGWIR